MVRVLEVKQFLSYVDINFLYSLSLQTFDSYGALLALEFSQYPLVKEDNLLLFFPVLNKLVSRKFTIFLFRKIKVKLGKVCKWSVHPISSSCQVVKTLPLLFKRDYQNLARAKIHMFHFGWENYFCLCVFFTFFC